MDSFMIQNDKLPFGTTHIDHIEQDISTDTETFYSTDERGTSRVVAQIWYLKSLIELHTIHYGSSIISI